MKSIGQAAAAVVAQAADKRRTHLDGMTFEQMTAVQPYSNALAWIEGMSASIIKNAQFLTVGEMVERVEMIRARAAAALAPKGLQ